VTWRRSASTALVDGESSGGEFFPYLLQQRRIDAEDVGERTIGDAPLALEQPNHRRQQRVETPRCICHALGVWFRCKRLACPDQDFAILVDGQAQGFDDLGLQIFEVVIIEIELPFEGAIGHAASPLEHSQGLIDNLLERHRRSSAALAHPPTERNVRHGMG
jgi:hypothetical protein